MHSDITFRLSAGQDDLVDRKVSREKQKKFLAR